MTEEPIVLYEDDSLLAISKPAGLVVHGDGRTTETTLIDWLTKTRPYLKDIGGKFELQDGTLFPRFGIAHRLDRDTSGVMLVGKTEEMFNFLRIGFDTHIIKKTYHGLVWGLVLDDVGTIDRRIGRAKNGIMWSVAAGAKGTLRDAVTKYHVLKRSQRFSLVEFFPLTGRTHQIRVHMKSLHRPLVSDALYGAREGKGLHMERTALHAYSLLLILPTGKELKIIAPYPTDFANAVEEMKLDTDRS